MDKTIKKLEYRYDDQINSETGRQNHLHLLSVNGGNWLPLTGTSGVSGVIAKTLTWWAAELAAVTCLEKGEKIETIRQEYEVACKSPDKKKAIDALQKKYPLFKKARFAHFERLNDSADEGTDTHSICEAYVKSVMSGSPVFPTDERVLKFVRWSEVNVKRFLWSEMYCFSERYWLGGIGDCGAEMMNGDYAILDFKSAKEVYFNNLIQVALYDIEITENGGFDKNGNKVFTLDKPITKYIIVPFGAVDLDKTMNDQLKNPHSVEKMKISSINALDLMRAKNEFEQ